MTECLAEAGTKAAVATCGFAPMGLLAELTHRCPLQCPYCSNPVNLDRTELDTSAWQDILRQAANLGVLQLHLSGGEPSARKDLEDILATGVEVGLYTNLITSGVLLTRERLAGLAKLGLDHVQLSIQDVEPNNADRIALYDGAMAKKREFAKWVRELDLPLTINVPVHRQNIENLPAMIDFAVEVGAARIEVAHIQYYAWALKNRAALIPTRAQFYESLKITDAARERLKGVLVFDVVSHDHYAVRPKPCIGGWGRSIITVTPSGTVLPCHSAATIPGLQFDNVREKPLAEIWTTGQAFQKFRGQGWMKEPCRSCDRKEIDYGGCRCQALAYTGDAANADPACSLSPWHKTFVEVAEREAAAPAPDFIYRRIGTGEAGPMPFEVLDPAI